MTPNTELAVIQAATDALMGQKTSMTYRATGHYQDFSRAIELDFDRMAVGPIIGSGGTMKLAIQSILACPFGGDACQIYIRSKREKEIEKDSTGTRKDGEERILAFLEAIKSHYHTAQFEFKTERSATTMVVLVKTMAIFVDQLRGPVSRALRAMGRRHGFVAVVSIEQFERTHAA